MEKILLGYVGAQTPVSEEDAKKLTHIHTAFGRLRGDGTIDTQGLEMLGQMEELRRVNPNLKISLSLVNGVPEAFTTCCGDSALRKTFAHSCKELITRYGFDGVDLDWEYPCVTTNGSQASPDDRENFTLTLRAIRRELDTLPGHPLLSIAAAAEVFYTECVDLQAISKVVDYICVMTYDLKGNPHAVAGHHTALYDSTGDLFPNSCARALGLFHRCGVPKEKLLLGAAFYSRKWVEVPDRYHGFLQLTKFGGDYGPGYGELARDYLNQQGFTYYWDDEAKAPYLFDGSTFLSFDDPRSLAEKCRFVLKEGYGGVFYWEHQCDPTGTLLDALYRGIRS